MNEWRNTSADIFIHTGQAAKICIIAGRKGLIYKTPNML